MLFSSSTMSNFFSNVHCSFRLLFYHRQAEDEFRTAVPILCVHCAAVCADNGVAYRKSQPHIALAISGGRVAVAQRSAEQHGQQLGRDAAAVVLHGKDGVFALLMHRERNMGGAFCRAERRFQADWS